MKKTIYITLFTFIVTGLLTYKSYSQQVNSIESKVFKKNISIKLSVSEKRAEEIYQILNYRKNEVMSVFLSKKYPSQIEMGNLKLILDDIKIYTDKMLTSSEKAAINTIVDPGIQQRKKAALERIRLRRMNQVPSETKEK